MKKKIKVTLNGKTSEGEINIRNIDHFNTQLNTRSHIFKAKKGKGSYRRKEKYHKEGSD